MRRPLHLLTASAGAAAGALAAGLRGRRRTAAAVEATRRRLELELAPPPAPSPEQLREEALVATLLERPEPPEPAFGNPISGPLAARVTEEDVAILETRLADVPLELWRMADDATRKRLVLTFCVAYEVQDAIARTGLVPDMPPEDVHAMARGPIAAGGDTFIADLVMSAVEDAGLAIRDGGTVLDFGASSGRVVRMIAAGRPDLECLACDPNARAIAWAAEHLPMARFFVSPLAPPLDLPDASVDLAYAISIWSHFAAAPALAWLEELHRIVRPGGALAMTTHGFDALAAGLRRGTVSPRTAAQAASAMVTTGHHFVDVFGEDGDWGVKDPGWGDAYFTLDWLLAQAGGKWAARLLWPGALDRSQDLVVLERL